MPYYISAEGLEKLKAELHTYKTTRRQEVASRLLRAKELGDLAENSEYQQAKEEQALVEKRIVELEVEIKDTIIIRANDNPDAIGIGNTVEVKSAAGKKEFTIVGSAEADPNAGKISNESPLGKAFLGHKKGDEVKAETPGGISKYKILAVR